MKIIPITKLQQTDYNVQYLEALKQFWKDTKTFSCIHQPKKQSIFLLLNGCKAQYTTRTGKTVYAESGDIVYAPQGCEYVVRFYDFERETSHTIGVNFYVFSKENESVLFSQDILVFKNAGERLHEFFEDLEMMSKNSNLRPTEYKLPIFQMINALARQYSKTKLNPVIQKGVEYLNSHYTENPSVSELASVCNVSEVYFRKLFKQAFCITPLEYRNRLRLKKAQQYLQFNDVSIREISELLGYATVSHFIKQFKAAFGVSPLQYKNASHTPIIPPIQDAD